MKNSKTIVFKRQQAILKALREQKNVEVDSLAAQLKVSAATIRRDLQLFENQKLIRRFHGGAQLNEETIQDEDEVPQLPGGPAMSIDTEEKKAIAKYAASLVNEGETIFINSGSTTLMMLDYLKNKRVVVVTNNANIINYPKDPKIEVILTGGELYQRKLSMVGDFALNTLTKIRANKAFIGVGGISAEGGITTSVLPETAINELMMKRSNGTCYVLAAIRKIGKEHNFLSGAIKYVGTLITCKGGNQEELYKLRKAGVNVIELDYQKDAE